MTCQRFCCGCDRQRREFDKKQRESGRRGTKRGQVTHPNAYFVRPLEA